MLTNTVGGQLADLELRHRRHARVEDRIRAAKDTGLRKPALPQLRAELDPTPSPSPANTAWLNRNASASASSCRAVRLAVTAMARRTHARRTVVPEALRGFDRFPVVVKPIASAGSDGIAICADVDQVRHAVTSLLGSRNAVGVINESVLVQEHLDGTQYVVNTVTSHGRHVVSDVFVSRFDEIDGKPISVVWTRSGWSTVPDTPRSGSPIGGCRWEGSTPG